MRSRAQTIAIILSPTMAQRSLHGHLTTALLNRRNSPGPGGTSLVRIAKVENGVERGLLSAPVPNFSASVP